MNKKVLGLITPTITLAILIGVLYLTMIATGSTFNGESWDLLGFVLFSVIIYIIVFIVYIVVGIILHSKKESVFGKGLLYGSLFLLVLVSIISIVISIII